MAEANFYRAFEDRYRGSRELVKSRLAVYLPFILPLQKIFDTSQGIDLGCGRGEWLELMQENGINVHGIDTDIGMLEAAHERNLNVSVGDAIATLQTLASDSQTLVSGFHIVEHLQFDQLQILVKESLRVLKPGGLLFLETPNPENVVVGTANFYLDPSHQRPIPPLLLSFLVEYCGFEKVKTLRLQEPVGLAEDNALSLMNVFNGVSQDYAIAAQKGGNAIAFEATAPAFELDYGLTLDTLASSYDFQIKSSVQKVESVAISSENKAHNAEVKAGYAENKANSAEFKAYNAENKANSAEFKAYNAELKVEQLEQRMLASEARIISLLESTSWKITAPLRMIGRIAKRILVELRNVKSKMKANIKSLLLHIRLYISCRPILNRLLSALLSLSPKLNNRLRQAMMPQTPTHIEPPILKEESCDALQASISRAAERWPLGRRVDAQ
jgi:O-antigen chain-terminating methyltransferase